MSEALIEPFAVASSRKLAAVTGKPDCSWSENLCSITTRGRGFFSALSLECGNLLLRAIHRGFPATAESEEFLLAMKVEYSRLQFCVFFSCRCRLGRR